MEILFTNGQYSSDYFKARNKKIENEILTSTDFSTNNILKEELIEKYVQKYKLPKYVFYKDNLKPKIKDIKKETPSVFWNSGFGPQYTYLEAKKFIYTIPFEGNIALSYYIPKRKIMGKFEVDDIWHNKDTGLNYLEISFSVKDSDLEKESNIKEYVEKEFNKIINPFIANFNNLNADIAEYNRDLHEFIAVLIGQRIKKDNLTTRLYKSLDIPLKTNENSANINPIPLKILKRAETSGTNQETRKIEYGIKDEDYRNIKCVIKQVGSMMEKLPSTFNKFKEEELRDIFLATLNTHYLQMAHGETFRNKGKTDILIEYENNAAYIAECKIWKEKKQIQDALLQLLGYTTWRDYKVSLIFFNKTNKNFISLTDKIKKDINELPQITNLKEIDKNEFEFNYNYNNSLIQVNFIIFNIFKEKNND